MTAIAIAKQSKGKMQRNGKCNAMFRSVTDAKLVDSFQCPECAMMTERADFFFSGPRLCWYSELFEIRGSFRDLAHESCTEGANHARGGVLKSALVDNDTVRTQHAVSLMVLTICSHSSQMRTLRNGSRKRSTACCDTQSQYFSMVAWRLVALVGARGDGSHPGSARGIVEVIHHRLWWWTGKFAGPRLPVGVA